MKQVGERLRSLRESIGVSQAKLAEILEVSQSGIARYEQGISTPTVAIFRKYADYFDVSMDYIFARCDDQRGKLYEAKPPMAYNNPEIQQFVEMCFDPSSSINGKLKETLVRMLQEGVK